MLAWLAGGLAHAQSVPPVVERVGVDQLNAVLWMQRAPEYRANALQTWRAAIGQLDAAAAPGTAATEQEAVEPATLAPLPTAVVLDIDETVLDNSVYQARLLQDQRRFEAKSWREWVLAAEAAAIPGALEFVQAAVARGHRVFYVTNRDCFDVPLDSEDPCPTLTATMKNLRALGFPNASDREAYLFQGLRPEWQKSAKTARRAWIAERYRIIMLIGDDLGDFVDQRVFAQRSEQLSAQFGRRWFALPNAMYGSWERGYADIAAKFAALNTTPAPLALSTGSDWKAESQRIRIAAWNIEYLLTPETHAALRDNCEKEGDRMLGHERRLPCAIAERAARTVDDYAALRKYAARLDADVVALQETDGAGAAQLVFPGYELCFSSRAHVQKNGFAIRRGLPFRCEPEYEPLSIGDRVRRGVVVTLFPNTPDAMTLMSVHLKSGCPAGPLNAADNRHCPLISEQVAPLEAWIDAQAAAGKRFGLLGDFNRRFILEGRRARDAAGKALNIWPEIDDGEPAGADLMRVTQGQRFRSCRADDPYREYIDDVILGRELARRVVKRSFVRVTYDAVDDARWLSDHCPVGVDLALR
jgi:5'-nucleotidase (lipoprotein e(P4) family)